MQTLEQLQQRAAKVNMLIVTAQDGGYMLVSDEYRDGGLPLEYMAFCLTVIEQAAANERAQLLFIDGRQAELERLKAMRRELVEKYPHETARLAVLDELIAATSGDLIRAIADNAAQNKNRADSPTR